MQPVKKQRQYKREFNLPVIWIVLWMCLSFSYVGTKDTSVQWGDAQFGWAAKSFCCQFILNKHRWMKAMVSEQEKKMKEHDKQKL